MAHTRERPFRTQPLAITDAETRRLGALPAAEALAYLEACRGEVDPQELAKWFTHPDERVALAAMEQAATVAGRIPHPRMLALVEGRSDQEVGVWTRLVDIAAHYARGMDRTYELRLAQWLRTASAEEAREILVFRHPTPAWIAAKELRHWSPELVRGIGTRQPNHIERLGRNKYLNAPEDVQALFDLSVERALGAPHTARARPAGNAVAHLFARTAPLPADAVDRLIQTVSDWTKRKGKGESVVAPLARAVGFSPVLTPRQAHRALTAARGRAEIVAALVEGPHIPNEVVLRALQETPRLLVRRSVIRRAELLRDPEIRAELERSDCANIRTSLIETAEPDEATRHLRHLGERNPYRALEAIESHLPEGAAVPIETATTLLSHEWNAVRERALRVVSKHPLARPNQTGEPSPETPAPSTPGPKPKAPRSR